MDFCGWWWFFCYFKNAEVDILEHFQARNWCDPGQWLSLASLDLGKLLTTVFTPTPPHHSADHLPSTPLQYSVLSGSFFGWSDGGETCLSVDAVEVKHLFKGLLTILFHAWHFSYLEALFFILRNLTWGLSVLWSSQRTSFGLCQSFLFSVALPCHQFLLLLFLPSTFSIFAVALCLISWVGCLACRLKKDVRLESCELSFICGEMRIAAQEAASQIALRICSEATVGKSQYIRFWWRGSWMPWSTHSTKGFLLIMRIWCHCEGI